MNRRTLLGILLLLIGLPATLTVMFLPGYLTEMQVEIDWRRHKDPYEFLTLWPRSGYELLALAELDKVQRPIGYISRLVSSRYGPEYLTGSDTVKAVWSPDARQVVTGSSTVAIRWDAATGQRAQVHGVSKRRDAEDPAKWGFGFLEVAWYGNGKGVAAMTDGPSSLWLFGPDAPGPRLLEPMGLNALTASGNRAAFLRSFQYGNVIDLSTGETVKLPHPDVTAIAFAPDDRVVTASLKTIQWWRGKEPAEAVTIEAAYNPLAFSDDAKRLLVLAQKAVEVWSTTTGNKLELVHESEASAACATGDTVVTGTDDGHVTLWNAADGSQIRRFRAGTTRIDLLACSPTKLLTVALDRTDARVWDMAGRPQTGPVITPAAPRIDWITRLGADADLPGRMPWLVDLAAQSDNAVMFTALGALVVLILAAQWLIRSGRQGRRPPG